MKKNQNENKSKKSGGNEKDKNSLTRILSAIKEKENDLDFGHVFALLHRSRRRRLRDSLDR
ncbi:hypothetical protein DERF_002617 [Dermatophagoides farinae]|uniref:Uncharacterized protein n=1 Tax=Dermatophagoides farinae TaxID=6954 RepID=A0A922IB04_DERFA|nr:hypothetical protein DERF_002617 [Dermatophagoides farinae]